jgi:hypothetical protein
MLFEDAIELEIEYGIELLCIYLVGIMLKFVFD